MKTQSQSKKIVKNTTSRKTPNTSTKRRQEPRHTISFDLSEGAYSLVVAHAKLYGFASPDEVALYALRDHNYAMITGMEENESRELFGIPIEGGEKA
jgi:hypothetical protein